MSREMPSGFWLFYAVLCEALAAFFVVLAVFFNPQHKDTAVMIIGAVVFFLFGLFFIWFSRLRAETEAGTVESHDDSVKM